MARVSHVLAMPAAVQDTGGVQHDEVTGARLKKVTEETNVSDPRSTCQNSELLDPPEL